MSSKSELRVIYLCHYYYLRTFSVLDLPKFVDCVRMTVFAFDIFGPRVLTILIGFGHFGFNQFFPFSVFNRTRFHFQAQIDYKKKKNLNTTSLS